jgi:pantothenate kinase
MLGITGAPGAGKSLFAAASARELGGALVPMDGFHLADAVLGRLGLLDRKGAPETFDAWGYAALLARLRERPGETVYAPGFERDLEQPLAGAIAVPPEADVVVTEGNYLLLDRPEWCAVCAGLDEVWFVFTDDEVRRERLVRRHVEFGKTLAEARAWVQRVDEPNARLVEASRHRATREVDLTHWVPPGGD